jgi:hypothetical protein
LAALTLGKKKGKTKIRQGDVIEKMRVGLGSRCLRENTETSNSNKYMKTIFALGLFIQAPEYPMAAI